MASLNTTDKEAEIPQEIVNALIEATEKTRVFFPSRSSKAPRGSPKLHGDEKLLHESSNQLAEHLYQEWYAHTSVRKGENLSLERTGSWVEVLRANHAGSYRWETGWRVTSVFPEGRIIAKRGLMNRILSPLDYYCPGRPGLPPAIDDEITAVVRRDSLTTSPGYWLTSSPAWRSKQKQLLRLYWNVTAAGTPELLRQLTAQIPETEKYCLKAPCVPAGYERTDTVVLYILRDSYSRLAPMIREVYQLVAPHLCTEVPKLTKGMADGLGLAESPAGGQESFGMHRCRLVAEGLCHAAAKSVLDDSSVIQSVSDVFRKAGLRLSHPYLESLDSPDYGGLSDDL
jgi:hypothetical protein